ncbi:hypothetical protein FSARC_4812 [Fusarium sarcochroum]|uniref:WAP domain-containing protein n=1 Tax=Fusarium sarcochroum TaxID=1208366 RepID=A0A8H4U0W7_9HYPO|nr:hypothetical protein FSARC_4812 [Fusarium sarcochroum]
MKFTTVLLLIVPLAVAGPAQQSAKGLPDLTSAGEGGHDLSSHGGGGLELAAKICPAKFPRSCPLNKLCCRTKKCCKKECCNNTARFMAQWTNAVGRATISIFQPRDQLSFIV